MLLIVEVWFALNFQNFKIMTWEETIAYIRTQPEYSDLVRDAYFDADLELNVERFKQSAEFRETVSLLKKYAPNAKTLLDVGCGNGVSTINLAELGYEVTAVEPDPSLTVGAGAIRILKDKLNLNHLTIFEDFAENIKFPDNSFDVVYVRQAMHHANELDKFIEECVRVLKPKGLLLTIRDHVIFNEADKQLFLKSHPLQKFYGGENAFTPKAYQEAFKKAGAIIVKELKFYDSVINYFPSNSEAIKEKSSKKRAKQKQKLQNKIGSIAKFSLVWSLYERMSGFRPLNEHHVAGRMYSYIAIKK